MMSDPRSRLIIIITAFVVLALWSLLWISYALGDEPLVRSPWSCRLIALAHNQPAPAAVTLVEAEMQIATWGHKAATQAERLCLRQAQAAINRARRGR